MFGRRCVVVRPRCCSVSNVCHVPFIIFWRSALARLHQRCEVTVTQGQLRFQKEAAFTGQPPSPHTDHRVYYTGHPSLCRTPPCPTALRYRYAPPPPYPSSSSSRHLRSCAQNKINGGAVLKAFQGLYDGGPDMRQFFMPDARRTIEVLWGSVPGGAARLQNDPEAVCGEATRSRVLPVPTGT